MTEAFLSRNTEQYAQAYLDKLGDKIEEMTPTEVLIGYVREVIEPRQTEKDGEGHH